MARSERGLAEIVQEQTKAWREREQQRIAGAITIGSGHPIVPVLCVGEACPTRERMELQPFRGEVPDFGQCIWHDGGYAGVIRLCTHPGVRREALRRMMAEIAD